VSTQRITENRYFAYYAGHHLEHIAAAKARIEQSPPRLPRGAIHGQEAFATYERLQRLFDIVGLVQLGILHLDSPCRTRYDEEWPAEWPEVNVEHAVRESLGNLSEDGVYGAIPRERSHVIPEYIEMAGENAEGRHGLLDFVDVSWPSRL